MKFVTRLLVVVCAFVAGTCLAAEPPAPPAKAGTIVGKAVDKTGMPEVEAIVHVRNLRGQEVGSGYTASNGTFAVAVPAGSNLWVFIQGKLAGRKTDVHVKAGERTDVGVIKLSEMRQ